MSRRAPFAVIALTAALLLALGGGRGALAQRQATVSVLAGFDRTHGTVGDPINLTVTVRYSPGVTIDTTGLDNQFAPFEVISASPPDDRKASDGSGERRLRYVIAAYQTGNLQLPALSVPYALDDQTGEAKGEPLSFAVESVIPQSDQAADIRPLKPQISLPAPAAGSLRLLFAIAAAAAALLVAAAIARMLLRGRGTVPALEQVAFERQPEHDARAELDALVEEGLLEQGYYRDHYARMAESIRRYVTKRYGFPASALTTSELGERMERGGVGRWRARLVAGLLTECDAVHYAHYLPAPARAEADLQMAYEIVDLALSQGSRPPEEQLEVGS